MTNRLRRWNEIGPRIARAYTAAGMSQRQFCARAGVSDTMLRPSINGEAKAVPRADKLAGMSRALGLPPGTLALVVDGRMEFPDPDDEEPDGSALPLAADSTVTLTQEQLAALLEQAAEMGARNRPTPPEEND